MKPKKKQRTRKGNCLTDEILFSEIVEFTDRNGILDMQDMKGHYVKTSDRGCDRLYSLPNHDYMHITPHIYAWHSDVPCEVIYGTMCATKAEPLVPSIKGYCVTSDGEVVTLYSPGRRLQSVYSLGITNSQNALEALLQFLERCRDVLDTVGTFPTVINPKRVYFDGTSFGFFETGHFQNAIWRANESLRIIDMVYSHPTCNLSYVPINALKTCENVYVDSLVAGLLNFFCGAICLLYFCVYGVDPVPNNSKTAAKANRPLLPDASTRNCSSPTGICQNIRSGDPVLKDIFHEFYCCQAIKTLPATFRVKMERQDYRREVLRRFADFLAAFARYLNGRQYFDQGV